MNLTDPSVVRAIAARHDFHFSKGLGQNFLINPGVCPRIAEEGGAAPGIGVLEIGTGFGVLTQELALRAERVCAVEIDGRLLPVLEETLAPYSNISIVHGDFMQLDLHQLLEEQFGDLPVVVCANLPYYITSPVLMRLLESRAPIQSVTVMVQREAADRLCAPVGSREAGAVTVAAQYYGRVQKLFSVSRGSFLPAPKVDSAVIRVDLYPELPWKVPERDFFRLVKAGFSQRRKTLANAAASMLGLEKGAVYRALEELGLPQAARMEQLTMEQLCALSLALFS